MSYKIISKFIKDISFEIPNTETFLMLEKEISKYNLNFDIKGIPLKNRIIEVNTMLTLTPNQEVKHKILTEINFATLISIDENFEDKKKLEKIILVEVPKIIYPTLYEIFVYLFNQTGIKNISIEKEVDFEKMYLDKKLNPESKNPIKEKTLS
jgi:preprotein translocase subunit SecB